MSHTEYCDLHAHSCFSDGMCTPEEVILTARDAHLKAVALTDHNTIAGLADFALAAEKHDVEPVYGCEFSTDYSGDELHILGLCLPKASWPAVAAYTEVRNRRKAQSNRECTERLAAA